MTNRLWPVDAVNGAPAEPGRGLRQLQSPFVHGATPARPLGARSGVRPGTGTPVSVSSTAWTVGAHAGILDLEAAAEAGPYAYAIDAAVSGTVTAASASNPRVDLLYVQMTDNSEDGTTPGQPGKVVVGYLAGVPAADPVVPATPPRALALSRVNVPRAGAGSPSATWIAPHATGPGSLLPVWNQAERDALTKVEPLAVWRLDKHWAEFWNGSGWEVVGQHAERASRADWNSGNGVGGGQVFHVASVPAQPQPQRVLFEIDGFVSPDSQGDAGIDVQATGGTVVQLPQKRIFTTVGTQWYGYSRRGYVDVPANSSASIRFQTESSVVSRYQVTCQTRTLAAGQF